MFKSLHSITALLILIEKMTSDIILSILQQLVCSHWPAEFVIVVLEKSIFIFLDLETYMEVKISNHKITLITMYWLILWMKPTDSSSLHSGRRSTHSCFNMCHSFWRTLKNFFQDILFIDQASNKLFYFI